MNKIKTLIERFTAWLHDDPSQDLELRVIENHLDALIERDQWKPATEADEAEFRACIEAAMDEHVQRMKRARGAHLRSLGMRSEAVRELGGE